MTEHADIILNGAFVLIGFLALCLGWSIRTMVKDIKDDFKSTKKDLYEKVGNNKGKIDRLLGEHNINHANNRIATEVTQ